MTINPSNLGTLSTGTIGGVSSVYNASLGLWQTKGPIEYVNAILSLVTFQLNSGASRTSFQQDTSNGTIEIHISDSFNQMISTQMTLILTEILESGAEDSRTVTSSVSHQGVSSISSRT